MKIGEITQEIQRKNTGRLVSLMRIGSGLSMGELAEKIGTKQPSISRAEKSGCSLHFLQKVALKTGYIVSLKVKKYVE